MEIIGGLFCFTALVGWGLLAVTVEDMTEGQRARWVGVTLVGRFMGWVRGWPSLRKKFYLHGFVEVGMLVIFGIGITEVSWVLGLLPLGMTVVEVVEVKRVLWVMRRNK